MTKYTEEPDKPFNDAMEHMHHIEGYPITKGGKLPLGIKIIGYFLFGGLFLMMLFAIVANIWFN
ncbi:hypothetical protein [Radiobacillus deserti]|uniref:Amino acid transporter n=1 Tax=Radiobacillus deserti TaxID=2594883 RepID=A0A516KJB7_9BACI|nr:hypothetical protein [Radiobacillus deserti]QDP41500.1 hypothetical protein FN924_15755 [Radiobacillus deserti]